MKTTLRHCLGMAILICFTRAKGVLADTTGVAAKVAARLTYIIDDQDRAGPWHAFTSGNARITGDSRDWHLKLEIDAPTGTVISALTFFHMQSMYPEEVWSTASTQVFEKLPYPIVVVDAENKQLNTSYDQALPAFAASHAELNLFLQRENPFFSGGALVMKFNDGSTLTVEPIAGAAPVCTTKYVDPEPQSTTDLVTCEIALAKTRNQLVMQKRRFQRAQQSKN